MLIYAAVVLLVATLAGLTGLYIRRRAARNNVIGSSL